MRLAPTGAGTSSWTPLADDTPVLVTVTCSRNWPLDSAAERCSAVMVSNAAGGGNVGGVVTGIVIAGAVVTGVVVAGPVVTGVVVAGPVATGAVVAGAVATGVVATGLVTVGVVTVGVVRRRTVVGGAWG